MKLYDILKQEHVDTNFYKNDPINGKILEIMLTILKSADEFQNIELSCTDDLSSTQVCVITPSTELNINHDTLDICWISRIELFDDQANIVPHYLIRANFIR